MTQLADLVAAATPGPWMGGCSYDSRINRKVFDVSRDPGDVQIAERLTEADARLVAALPELAQVALAAEAPPRCSLCGVLITEWDIERGDVEHREDCPLVALHARLEQE